MALFTAARAAVDRYNAAIATANSAIDAKKSAVAAGNLKDEEATLTRLNAQKKRHDTKVPPICADYQRLSEEKEALDKSKAHVRTKLEEHTNKVIKPYEGRINQLLDNFNADSGSHKQSPPTRAGSQARSTRSSSTTQSLTSATVERPSTSQASRTHLAPGTAAPLL